MSRGFCRSMILLASVLVFSATPGHAADDPLPSWNDGATRDAIVGFVESVTQEGSSGYVAPYDRIAVFDNDGTLWAEKPAYVQLLFAVDRVKALSPDHPEWKTEEPFASILKGDLDNAFPNGLKDIAKLIAVTHSGMSEAEFAGIVRDWMKTAENPVKKRPYAEMIYQPMVELLAYLRANGFKTFIVSGGGVDFMRVFTEEFYGIPPQQVVGSSGKLKFELKDGKPEVLKLPELNFIDDGPGKPVGIAMNIGRLPIAAFGNSDGDLQMLQYTCLRETPHFCAFVHHTDAAREWAYDTASSVGKLDKGLAAASENGWTMIDMKDDWKTVFPAE